MTQMDGNQYHDSSRKFLLQAQEELARGDLRQASEKLWGSASQMVKAIAQQKGWDHATHRDLHKAIGRLVQETGDGALRDLFFVASHLHTNFYEGYLTFDDISAEVPKIVELVGRLRALAAPA